MEGRGFSQQGPRRGRRHRRPVRDARAAAGRRRGRRRRDQPGVVRLRRRDHPAGQRAARAGRARPGERGHRAGLPDGGLAVPSRGRDDARRPARPPRGRARVPADERHHPVPPARPPDGCGQGIGSGRAPRRHRGRDRRRARHVQRRQRGRLRPRRRRGRHRVAGAVARLRRRDRARVDRPGVLARERPAATQVDGIWMFVGTERQGGIVPLAPDLAYVLLIEEPPPGGERVPDDRLAATMRERLAEFGGDRSARCATSTSRATRTSCSAP